MIIVQFIQWKLQHFPDNQEAIKNYNGYFTVLLGIQQALWGS